MIVLSDLREQSNQAPSDTQARKSSDSRIAWGVLFPGGYHEKVIARVGVCSVLAHGVS